MTISHHHSALKTVVSGVYHPPSTFEDLSEGIKTMTSWLLDPYLPHARRSVCQDWLKDASDIMAAMTVPPTMRNAIIPQWPTREDLEKAMIADAAAQIRHKADGPIGPQICTKCKFKNDYAGREHLSADGSYTCRGCK